jgi:hypothetical protein
VEIGASDAALADSGVRGSVKDERKTRNALPKVKILGSRLAFAYMLPKLTIGTAWQNVLKKLVERFPLTLQGKILIFGSVNLSG